ncbi:MAG: hypothetical protein E7248_14645 [Paenibacillaceae bacterium]|jgi:hypothetical protein|nr:hypothetical protein [Paenibacillaceae bacterium]
MSLLDNPKTKLVAKILIKHVSENKGNLIITYGEVSKLTDNAIFHRNLRSHLYAIADVCKELGLPHLTAVVCRKGSILPGDGFFNEYFPGLNDQEKHDIFVKCLNEIRECDDWSKLIKYME